ncbi:VanZ family protein [Capnocytophaga cynodegmi]|uniref:VanZ family protein n=1 Tax=Capnocytophaga cynodegmi TaxID=28189 RepID=UPI00385C19F5
MLNKRKFTILLGIWFIVVVTLSLMPGDSTPDLPRIPYIDKIAHFTFYFVFTVLFFLTLKNECKCVKKIPYIYLISALFAFLLGISIELLQKTITTTRSGDIYDVFFNSFGTIVALVFVTIINKKSF